MIDEFLLRALLAGIGLSIAAGPLGCFVVWRQMAYFGDATSHAAVLGVAFALLLGMPLTVGTLAIAFLMGITVSALSARGHGMDSTLGVLAHSALALGLVAISFASDVRFDVTGLLFGDILAVGYPDLMTIYGGAALVGALLIWRWNGLLTSTLNPELATAAGIAPKREQLVLTLALAMTVAIAIKVVGALLISAMLLLPAVTARAVSRTPEAMALLSIVLGVVAVCGGLAGSYFMDTPTGPSIVAAAALIFALSLPLRRQG